MGNIVKTESYKEKCKEFFIELSIALGADYELVESCNNDISRYLIPKGTREQITYYGKPDNSFRLSDHWNWYSSLFKCNNEHYIQCFSVDAPWSKKRVAPGKASKPIYCVQVCVMGEDKKYHCVYGERFNRRTKTWEWIESDPYEVAQRYKSQNLLSI